jgi:hypothetical protein
VLATVRTWRGVVERKPGVFYAGGEPFLHFHLLVGNRRRADIKGRRAWSQLDLPRPVTMERRQALLRQLRLRYAEKISTRSGRRLRRQADDGDVRPGGSVKN